MSSYPYHTRYINATTQKTQIQKNNSNNTSTNNTQIKNIKTNVTQPQQSYNQSNLYSSYAQNLNKRNTQTSFNPNEVKYIRPQQKNYNTYLQNDNKSNNSYIRSYQQVRPSQNIQSDKIKFQLLQKQNFIIKLNQEIKSLKKQNDSIRSSNYQQIQKLKSQLKYKDEQIQKNRSNNSNVQLNQEIRKLKGQNELNNQEIQKLKFQLKNKDEYLKTLSLSNSQIRLNQNQKTNMFAQRNNENKAKQYQRINKLRAENKQTIHVPQNQKINGWQQQYKYFKSQFQKANSDRQLLTKQKQKLSKELKLIKSNVQMLKTQNEEQKKKIQKNYKSALKSRQQQTDLLRKQVDEAVQENKKLQNQIEYKDKEIIKLQNQIRTLKSRSAISLKPNENIELNNMKRSNNELTELVKRLQSDNYLLKDKCNNLQLQIKKLKQQNSDLRFQISKLIKNDKPNFRQNRIQNRIQSRFQNKIQKQQGLVYFHGQILRNKNNLKSFLKQEIQNITKYRIKDTKFLYTLDPFNKQNLHKYIDQKQQIVLILYLSNGTILAGYYEGFFKSKTQAKKKGLLFSLTSKRVFKLKQNCQKAIVNDDFYVIFGNSQIRLRTQQKKLFSNFGLGSSYYDSQGLSVADFLGGNKNQRQVELINYEFHQLIFAQR